MLGWLHTTVRLRPWNFRDYESLGASPWLQRLFHGLDDTFDLEAMETSLQPWTCSERFVVSDIPWSGPHGCVEPPKHSGAVRKGVQPGPILPFFVVKMVPVCPQEAWLGRLPLTALKLARFFESSFFQVEGCTLNCANDLLKVLYAVQCASLNLKK